MNNTKELTRIDCLLISTLRPYIKRTLYKIAVPFAGTFEHEVFEDTTGGLWCIAYDVPAKEEKTEGSYTITHYCRRYDESETTDKYCLVDSDAVDRLLETNAINKRQPPKVITAERYFDMLEILPPQNWHSVAGFSVFCIMEAYDSYSHHWYAQSLTDKTECYEFLESPRINDKDLTILLNKLKG